MRDRLKYFDVKIIEVEIFSQRLKKSKVESRWNITSLQKYGGSGRNKRNVSIFYSYYSPNEFWVVKATPEKMVINYLCSFRVEEQPFGCSQCDFQVFNIKCFDWRSMKEPTLGMNPSVWQGTHHIKSLEDPWKNAH